MGIVASTIKSVDDSPAVLLSAATLAGGRIDRRDALSFYNAGPDEVYVGGSTVTAATGRPVAALAVWDPPFSSRGAWYGICASGESASVHVTEER